jgi:hypothetical protein
LNTSSPIPNPTPSPPSSPLPHVPLSTLSTKAASDFTSDLDIEEYEGPSPLLLSAAYGSAELFLQPPSSSFSLSHPIRSPSSCSETKEIEQEKGKAKSSNEINSIICDRNEEDEVYENGGEEEEEEEEGGVHLEWEGEEDGEDTWSSSAADRTNLMLLLVTLSVVSPPQLTEEEAREYLQRIDGEGEEEEEGREVTI